MAVCISRITADELFEKLKLISVDHPLCRYSYERCLRLTPVINEILELKAEQGALILAHTYVHPDIIYGVADHVGDSYGLAKKARSAEEKTIVFPSVRFMAETAKILNPEKKVLDPNPNGGCTLADSIDAEEVYRLRNLYPDHTFVCYINTTAAVKAACDVCVTSSNIYRIFERIPSRKIYFLPDRLMAENAKKHLLENGIDKEIVASPGTCYVHEEFEPESVDLLKTEYPHSLVFAHPECKPEVVEKADFVGSTSEMHRSVVERQNENRPFLLLTECGVASRLSIEAPRARLIGGCSLCKYMRSNSLNEIARALRNPRPSQIIEIEPSVLDKARLCIERMFEYAE